MRVDRLIVVGFLFVLAGAVLPFLMVIGLLPKTMFLSFLSYGVSIAGLFLGLMGAARFAVERRKEDDGQT